MPALPTYHKFGSTEVGQSHRQALIKEIKGFIDQFAGQGHQFVLTTRKFDYEYDFVQQFPSDDFEPLEILELDSAGVNEFIMRDLGQISHAYTLLDNLPPDQQASAKAALDALKRGDVTTDQDSQELLVQAQQRFADLPASADIFEKLTTAQKLLNILGGRDYQRLLWLAQNPGTLRDIIDVYQDKAAIPRSRTRLSERAIQARLRIQAARRVERNEPSRFPQDTKFTALQAVAFQMIDVNKGLNITRQDIIAIFQKHVRQEEAELLLKELIFSDTLLVEPAEKWYAFVKQPYQEYFVARELRDRWVEILKEGKDPRRDNRMQKFLRDRAYWQVTSAMASLLNEEQVTSLVIGLRKKKSTQRLAALCVRNAESLPTYIIEEFISWANPKKFLFLFTVLDYICLIVYILFILFYILFSLSILLFALFVFLNSLYFIIITLAIFIISFYIIHNNNEFKETHNIIRYPIHLIGNIVLNIYILHRIDILGDMQPYTTNAFINIEINFANNPYLSPSIASAIERALVPSPRTILQVIEDINKPERHAEIVQVVGSVVLQPDINNTIREKGVDALFRIVEQAANISTAQQAIDELGKLALEQLIYRERVSGLFKQVISNPKYPLNVRSKARQGLQNLGWQDMPPLRLTLRETLNTWRMTVAVMLSLCAVVLGILWWTEQLRWWIGFGLAGLLLAIASISMIRTRDLWIAYYYYKRGIACSTRGDYNLAVAYFTKAIELDPYEANYYNKQGDAYQEMGDYERAIANYTKAIELAANNAWSYNNRGNTYQKQGQYELAIADYVKAIELNPELLRSSYYDQGHTYHKQGNYARAIANYTKVIELDPNHIWSYENRAHAYQEMGYYERPIADYTKAGDNSRQRGDYARSIANYTQAIKLDPNHVKAYNNRGFAYYRQGEYNLAIADYTKAIELDPHFVWAYQNRGDGHYNKKEYDEAFADFTKAIELDPDYPHAYHSRGFVYLGQGDYDQAIADFTKAIELNPENAAPYHSRGFAYLEQGDYERAITDFNRSLELKPDLADSYSARGYVYYEQGDYFQALVDCTTAIKLNSDYAEVYYLKGMVYQELGNFNAAMTNFQRCLALNPDPDLCEKAEKRLRELAEELSLGNVR